MVQLVVPPHPPRPQAYDLSKSQHAPMLQQGSPQKCREDGRVSLAGFLDKGTWDQFPMATEAGTFTFARANPGQSLQASVRAPRAGPPCNRALIALLVA